MKIMGVVACLLGLWGCDRSTPKTDPPEPEVQQPPPPEPQNGCTIHWLGESNSMSIGGVVALPDGRFVVQTTSWTGDEGMQLRTFDDRGTPGTALALPADVTGIEHFTADADGTVWLLGGTDAGYRWYHWNGAAFEHSHDITREQLSRMRRRLGPHQSPDWSIEVDYDDYPFQEALVHHAADGSVDWRLASPCPMDAVDCRLGRMFEVIDDRVFVLLFSWSIEYGPADGFRLLVAQKDVGWIEEHDLTAGPMHPHNLQIDGDGALWMLGTSPDSLIAHWAQVDSSGALGALHALAGPADCMHNSMAGRTAFFDDIFLQGRTCRRYDDGRVWMAVVDEDESVIWQRHLRLMNYTRADIAWNDRRRFVLAGGTQDCCYDAPATIPFVIITDEDAACLDSFAPMLPPDPWDN